MQVKLVAFSECLQADDADGPSTSYHVPPDRWGAKRQRRELQERLRQLQRGVLSPEQFATVQELASAAIGLGPLENSGWLVVMHVPMFGRDYGSSLVDNIVKVLMVAPMHFKKCAEKRLVILLWKRIIDLDRQNEQLADKELSSRAQKFLEVLARNNCGFTVEHDPDGGYPKRVGNEDGHKYNVRMVVLKAALGQLLRGAHPC